MFIKECKNHLLLYYIELKSKFLFFYSCLLSVLGFFIVLGTVYDIITVQLRSEKEPEQQDIKDTPQQLNGQLQDYNVDYKNAGVLNGGFVGDSEGPNKTMEAETVIGTAEAKTIIPDLMVTKTVEPKLKPAERGTCIIKLQLTLLHQARGRLNHIALRIIYNFGRKECNKVKTKD